MALGTPAKASPQILTVQGHPTGYPVAVEFAQSTNFLGIAPRGQRGYTTLTWVRPPDNLAYATNDMILDSTTAPDFTKFTHNPCRVVGETALLRNIWIYASGAEALVAMTVLFLTAAPTLVAATGDNSPYTSSITGSPILFMQRSIAVQNPQPFNDKMVWYGNFSQNTPVLVDGSFCCIIARGGAVTPAASTTYIVRFEWEYC